VAHLNTHNYLVVYSEEVTAEKDTVLVLFKSCKVCKYYGH